jgi:hypothetical protein
MRAVAKKSNKSAGEKRAAQANIPLASYYLLLALIILSAASIRWRLREMPLERDEGEYAYAGQLMLQGIPPYELAYNMKLPGAYAAYALILGAFGQTPTAVHIGLLLVNAATTLLIFLLARRLLGNFAGLIAGATYALLSTSESVLGFAGHATHFVVLPAVAGILLLVYALDPAVDHPALGSKRNPLLSSPLLSSPLLFASGLLAGLAFLMKQPGIFFAIFSGVYIVFHEFQKRISPGMEPKLPFDFPGVALRLASYLVGVTLPFALTCLWMWRDHVFQKFWFWTFSYAAQYGTASFSSGMAELWEMLPNLFGFGVFLWIIALVGLTALAWDANSRKLSPFLGSFTLFSFLAVCPGLYFRAHYFILMLPAVALLAGLALRAAQRSLANRGLLRFGPVLLFLAACIYPMIRDSEFLFDLDPIAASRRTYGINPFVEAVEVADYLRNHSAPDAKIAILGSEPEIYFYAHRHSATGYIYVYPLMEAQKYAATMQQEMIAEIEASRPEFMVIVNISYSWLMKPSSNTSILDWASKYISAQYQQAGIADMGPTSTQYVWGADAATYSPSSPYNVMVFKRRSQ